MISDESWTKEDHQQSNVLVDPRLGSRRFVLVSLSNRTNLRCCFRGRYVGELLIKQIRHVEYHLVLITYSVRSMSLTRCGLVPSFNNIDLGNHWLRTGLFAWRYQTITFTDVDSSSLEFSSINWVAVSQEMVKIFIHHISLKITNL